MKKDTLERCCHEVTNYSGRKLGLIKLRVLSIKKTKSEKVNLFPFKMRASFNVHGAIGQT